MPRAVVPTAVTQAATIVNFFRTANREVADLVMGLSKEALRERDAKVAKIKQGQKKGQKKAGKATPAAGEVVDLNAQVDATTRSAVAPKRRRRGGAAGAVETQPELPAGAGHGAEVAGDAVEEAPAGEEAVATT